jgi:hypothetical protein
MASNPNTVTTQPAYDKWCNLNNFKSKLPKTVCERKEAALAEDQEKQQSLDPHIITDVPGRGLCHTQMTFSEMWPSNG